MLTGQATRLALLCPAQGSLGGSGETLGTPARLKQAPGGTEWGTSESEDQEVWGQRDWPNTCSRGEDVGVTGDHKLSVYRAF